MDYSAEAVRGEGAAFCRICAEPRRFFRIGSSATIRGMITVPLIVYGERLNVTAHSGTPRRRLIKFAGTRA